LIELTWCKLSGYKVLNRI